jgi:hypothetical protein
MKKVSKKVAVKTKANAPLPKGFDLKAGSRIFNPHAEKFGFVVFVIPRYAKRTTPGEVFIYGLGNNRVAWSSKHCTPVTPIVQVIYVNPAGDLSDPVSCTSSELYPARTHKEILAMIWATASARTKFLTEGAVNFLDEGLCAKAFKLIEKINK